MNTSKIKELFEKKYPKIIGCEIEYIKRDEVACKYLLQIEPEQPYVPSYLRTLSDEEIFSEED